jgi:hypothetical protein
LMFELEKHCFGCHLPPILDQKHRWGINYFSLSHECLEGHFLRAL